ncbi:glycosyl hydrolase [Bacillus luti]|uniref:WD40/YVTN/BNR-like repeat-containing protein n=1 Tax=Bacillus luti TaxID=2026191 RepID=UPI0008FDE231|nr:glycosyl hydrolase [Bacillus luti]OJE49021.1 glycosyl hydrolase [Bacillus luti]
MEKFILAFDRELVIAEKKDSTWSVQSQFVGANPVALALDPYDQERMYCGTFDRGLWRSKDGGSSWEAIGTLPSFGEVFSANAIHMRAITAVSVSPEKGDDGNGIVYVGIEPSAMFVSKNGGDSFELLTDYRQMPSYSSWFFPQRTYTHHVKHIEIDANNPETIYTTIEVGGLIKSVDGGMTWTEEKEGNYPQDIHVLKSHRNAPNRLYGVLGDSFLKEPGQEYAESNDGGKTWNYMCSGLKHHYAYQMAVNPNDPENIIIATSSNPHVAHDYNNGNCESFIYKKEKDQPWAEMNAGLPTPKGTIIPVLKATSDGTFYLFSNKGVYQSVDGGSNWTSLEIPWENRFMEQHPYEMLIIK